MYWQQRFDRQNPDAALEAKIKAIRQSDKDFGYGRIWGKSRKYSSYKGTVGRIASNRLRRRFDTCIPHQKITTALVSPNGHRHKALCLLWIRQLPLPATALIVEHSIPTRDGLTKWAAM